jgi:hypothetical protein
MRSLSSLKRLLILSLVLGSFLVAGRFANKSYSANLTTVSFTLGNSRLSFFGGLASGNAVGTTLVTINTTPGSFPSTSSAQLVQGDVVAIGDASTLSTYTVASTSSESTFSITSGLGSGDTDAGDHVISTQSGQITVRFTTANAIPNGRFRILVPSVTSDTDAADGIPDSGKFDMSATLPTVTCPSNADTTYDFYSVTNGNNGDATASAQTVASSDYHVFECAYSGTGAAGTAFNGTSNGAIVISNLINPAPKAGHTSGTADTYQVVVQHLDSSLAVQDSTAVGVGAIEAVKITATVPSQINFSIIGIASGTSACGVTTDVTTTATAVPFGEVSLEAFTDAAQTLTVSTNAVGGYSVTARANDQLGRNGGTCTGDPTPTGNTSCINDSKGDTNLMEYNVVDEWDLTTIKGFAYTLHDVNSSISNGSAEAFSYNQNSGNCSGGSYCARQFADTEDGESATEIFGSNTVADNENLRVCYRILPSTVTAAGDYENYVTYTATGTF